ncbi:tetratricopeptide repeat protein 5-like [Saccostrea echinata]|uniref:tetratricopeptide repeat protein 5-like n=1 Tax=Saccostrea echinata TaxID=191078 RepID=UPI002A82F8D2|nr:tetratricopeptide repeat protein 5-like [Saccostrea echinata]
MTSLDIIMKAVDDLYSFRDHFVENHGIEKAAQKTEEVSKLMNETLKTLETHKDNIKDKAVFYMLQGKTLNVLPTHSPQSEEILSKAVKLDPKLVEAWNQLGENYWKKGDVPLAKNCFTGALNHAKNKISLRNLSMVLRQIGGNPSERAKLVEESVEKAKEAVQLDIQDGTSWLILGNAYMSLFFAVGQASQALDQSMKAYAQAEKDPVARDNPDLHFNRAVAYKYEENYTAALSGFSRASQLDPSWPDPQTHESHLLTFLSNVTELTQSKGKIKPKKLQSMIESIKPSDLGPYGGGTYTSPLGKSVDLVKCKFSDLKPEVNQNKVILGKVVCTITTSQPVPFSFCMVDEEETCLPVTVYNMAQGCGVKIGDSVAIPEPYLQDVKVNHKNQKFEFSSIRVNSPLVLVVNGKKFGVDKQAPSVLAVHTMCE